MKIRLTFWQKIVLVIAAFAVAIVGFMVIVKLRVLLQTGVEGKLAVTANVPTISAEVLFAGAL